jgi:choice-of-anchor C domain-containing protein
MRRVRIRPRQLFVGIGMVGALTGLGALLAPSASALPAGVSGDAQGCQVTPGDTFETPVVPPGTFRSIRAGQSIGPWTVTGNDVDLIGEGFWQAADGVQSVDLEGSSTPFNVQGGVKRTFDTDALPLPLFTYTITYCVAGNPDGPPVVKKGQLLVNGTLAQNFSFDTTGKSRTNMGYTQQTFSFTPSGSSTTVEFKSVTIPGGYGPVIDKVTLKKCFLGLLCF